MTQSRTTALLLSLLITAVLGGCTSSLKAVTGTYSYYEVVEGNVTYFR